LKDAYYFSHDSNARNDPKICAALCVYPKAYQWYFMLVELMREQDEYKLRLNARFSLETYRNQLHCEVGEAEELQQFIQDCVTPEKDEGFGLFETDGTYFWSESLLRRMKKMDEIHEKLSNAGRKGGLAKAGLKQEGQSKAVAIKERKGKETKEKKEKIEDYVLLENEYFKLFKEKYGEEPDYVYQRDRAILKRYLEKNGVEKLLEVIRVWFREDIGDWHGFTIPKMQGDYNKIMAAIGKDRSSEGPIHHRSEGSSYGGL